MLAVGACTLFVGNDNPASGDVAGAGVIAQATAAQAHATDAQSAALAPGVPGQAASMPPGMDAVANFLNTGDAAYLMAASPDQFERCLACREFLLQRIGSAAASPITLGILFNWLASAPSGRNIDFLVRLGAALEMALPGSSSNVLRAEQLAHLAGASNGEQLLDLVRLEKPPAWFLDTAAERAKRDPAFARLVFDAFAQTPGKLERERLVAMMDDAQLRVAIAAPGVMGNRAAQQSIFERVSRDASVENIDTVLQGFRNADWQTASGMGRAWAGGQLSGDRLDALGVLLDSPTLSTIDRKAIAYLLMHAEDRQGAARLLDRYQLY